MVVDGAQVEPSLLGDRRVEAAHDGLLFVDMSTIAPPDVAIGARSRRRAAASSTRR